LNDNHVVRFGGAALSGWHMNVRCYPPVKRDHIRKPRRVRFKTADHGVVRTLDDADDAPFEAARRLALDAHEHTIAVHRFSKVRGCDVNVSSFPRLRVVGSHESKAARIGLQTSGDKVVRIRQRKPISANLRQLSGNDEALEIALERNALLARDSQQTREFARGGRMSNALLEERQNLFG
jgi:hypothetical protein